MRYLVLLLMLAGCATPEQRAMQAMAEFGPYCQKLGYQRDTDAWRHCIQIEDAKAADASYRAMQMMQMPPGPCDYRYGRPVFC